jgi:hypothetical protein
MIVYIVQSNGGLIGQLFSKNHEYYNCIKPFDKNVEYFLVLDDRQDVSVFRKKSSICSESSIWYSQWLLYD